MARPSKINQLELGKVRKLAEVGCTDEQIADFFGICRDTLSEYKKKYPEFSDTIKAGKKISDEKVERSLFERACGYEHPEDKIFCNDGQIIVEPTTKHYPPDTVACIFWLKNRKPNEWRDTQAHELSGPGGKPLTSSADKIFSLEELKKLIDKTDAPKV